VGQERKRSCRECERLNRLANYYGHHERNRERYWLDSVKARVASGAYRKTHVEECRERVGAWKARNKERGRVQPEAERGAP